VPGASDASGRPVSLRAVDACHECVKMDSTLVKHGDEMHCNSSVGIRGMLVLSVLLVSACAGYSGSNLNPGVSTLPEVLASMGQPVMAWKNPDASEQLA
jgi:hypothetical protein